MQNSDQEAAGDVNSLHGMTAQAIDWLRLALTERKAMTSDRPVCVRRATTIFGRPSGRYSRRIGKSATVVRPAQFGNKLFPTTALW